MNEVPTHPQYSPSQETRVLDRLSRALGGHPAPTLAEIRRALLVWLRHRLDAPRLDYAVPLSRMPGGTDTGTGTYRFRLRGAPPGLGGTLVLRLYAFVHGTGRAVRESRVQAALARTGYPVPEVHFTCTDRSLLGGAFFIMQFLPGESLAHAPAETIPAILCRAHLSLHRIDPAPVIESLREQHLAVAPHRPGEELARMAERARKYPRLKPMIDWMSEHLPPTPARLSICHGDFHPLNIVVRGVEVTGVCDWPNFMVADRTADVGSTMTLGIPARHLFSSNPHHRLWDRYLESYRREICIDPSVLDYYRTRRCLMGLLAGAGGRRIWRHPAIVRDLIADLRERTGVALASAPWDA